MTTPRHTTSPAGPATIAGDHCECCGSTDYEDLYTGDQGYTACCNEPTCGGVGLSRYGTPTLNVLACCWGAANAAGVRDGCRMSDR